MTTTPAPANLPTPLAATGALVLAPQQMEALGLEATDRADVLALAKGLDWSQRDALIRFGRDAAQQSAHYADQMLSQVRAGDVEGLGSKLTEIVASAQPARPGGEEIPRAAVGWLD